MAVTPCSRWPCRRHPDREHHQHHCVSTEQGDLEAIHRKRKRKAVASDSNDQCPSHERHDRKRRNISALPQHSSSDEAAPNDSPPSPCGNPTTLNAAAGTTCSSQSPSSVLPKQPLSLAAIPSRFTPHPPLKPPHNCDRHGSPATQNAVVDTSSSKTPSSELPQHSSTLAAMATNFTAPPQLELQPDCNQRGNPVTLNVVTGTSSSQIRCHINLLGANLLSAIFSKIDSGTDEVFRTVPLVCKSWCLACRVDNINLRGYRSGVTKHLDDAVRSVARRCSDLLEQVVVSNLSDEALDFVLSVVRHLKVLAIRCSPVTDDVLQRHADHLLYLVDVDFSYCENITASGIRTLGKSCPLLTRLTRRLALGGKNVDDSEPLAIAETMSVLDDLFLEDERISEKGVKAIVESCLSLRYIDLTGCLGLGDDFWSKMLEISLGIESTNGFRGRPIITNQFRYFLHPV